MKQTTFEIRAYGVGELAELYSPHMSHRGAIMQLWRWINYHGVLKAKPVSYTHLTLPTS